MNDIRNIRDVVRFFSGATKKEVVEKLQQEGFLRQRMRCKKSVCRRECTLVARAQYKGGYAFRCCRCKNKYFSVTGGTFFQNLHIDFGDVFLVLWMWACLVSPGAATELSALTPKSVYTLYRYFVDLCSWKLVNSPQLFIYGGEGHVVQVTDCKMREKCVLVIYDVTGKTGSVNFVEDRETETFCDLILQHALPGTEIWTDGSDSYGGLDLLGGVSPYVHRTTGPSHNFVDPETGVSTNQVKGFWSRLKGFCQRLGIMHSNLLEEHFDHFMWRQHFGGGERGWRGTNSFRNIVAHMKERYPVKA